MKICSLLPSATEILYALGLGDHVVGVSHACDFPSDAREKPVVSKSIRDVSDLSSQEIDEIIQQARSNNNPVHWIDGDVLRDVSPDLIITQELCEVCAVSYNMVEESVRELEGKQTVLSFEPQNLEGIFESILKIGRFTDSTGASESLVYDLKSRVANVMHVANHVPKKPKVLALEWLAPPFIGGHWVPEMIKYAGGIDVMGVIEPVSYTHLTLPTNREV